MDLLAMSLTVRVYVYVNPYTFDNGNRTGSAYLLCLQPGMPYVPRAIRLRQDPFIERSRGSPDLILLLHQVSMLNHTIRFLTGC